MVTAEASTHVRLDHRGVAWIDDTNVKVIEVILDHLTYGHSPEEIQLQHPHLSLAQVYAAFAYYYDHQNELDADMQQRFRKVEALRAKSRQPVSRRKLLARIKRR
jgi:uncharacterized protein (DUF433 family)